MPPEQLPKSVRKGTRSCVECRHRKVRCVWLSEGARSCQNCLARDELCEMQVHMMATAEAVTATSRSRISQLESNLSNLWTVVRNLETQVGIMSSAGSSQATRASQIVDASHARSKPGEGDEVEAGDDDNPDSDSDASGVSPTTPPSHLLQLFDNGLLDSYGYDSPTSSRHAPSVRKAQVRLALRELMPSREDMLTITLHASSWLSLYNALFPMINLTRTREEMMSQYDKLQDLEENAIAALLLSVAITVQQAPNDTAGLAAESIRDASSFVKDVSDLVERTVISDDALAGNLEGIETTLLFLRLQLGRASVRKMWLLIRRVIALAELIGLPRASMANALQQESLTGGVHSGAPPSLVGSWRHKAEVWESICAIDRIISMIWSLSLGTASYPLPKRPIIDSQGQVNPQAYLYSLAEIASRVLDLDNLYVSGSPLSDLFNAVVVTDQELRSLASLPPRGWRKIHWSELSIDALLQYWHQYLIVRTHLQLALKYEEGQEFAFNFITCLDACQDLARRYISIRPILPPGFFANQLIDLQTFTASVFLLLTGYRTSRGPRALLQAVDVNVTTSLVDEVIRLMELAAHQTRAGGDFAHQAVGAVRSLRSLLQQPHPHDSQKITLNLAFVGRIHVSRKPYANRTVPVQAYPTQSQQPQGLWHTPTSSDTSTPCTQPISFPPSDVNMMDSLSYSIEIPENYPLLTDPFGTEQWFTWTGWDGN